MKKEEFKAFCRGRHLTLTHLRIYFGIEEEETFNSYLSGALAIPAAISEKIEEIIFLDTVALPASSQQEKLDQLLSITNQLPHQGEAVNKRIDTVILDASQSRIEEKYLGYDAAFWQAFQNLYQRKCKAEKLYVQVSLFNPPDYHLQVG